ncbi:hypothetical protein [Caldimonas brevitalea]|uniref:Uncharacterized protein n=1 Tax=Caldimonas brevitalea TaxID=413882 RepID=A0A0G3BSB2_9BURK|nr:hypothetical protein [Caldimonas brevitalea]AKJ30893.1 hypothetical protein AAW51_4202 [Caldimonas brevitalea]
MTLPTTRLGRTDLTVLRPVLRTTTVGLPTDEAGIDLIDTADVHPLGGAVR